MSPLEAFLAPRCTFPALRAAPGRGDCCAVRFNPLVATPHTPPRGFGAWQGPTGDKPPRAIAFSYLGHRGVCGKPVVTGPCNLVTPRGSKAKPPTPKFQNPRLAFGYPRVGLFFPRVTFRAFAPSPSSTSLFSLEKEREERGAGASARIPAFFDCLFFNPRVCYQIGSYSVDEMAHSWTVKPYESMTYGDAPRNPRSTGKNAYTPAGGSL